MADHPVVRRSDGRRNRNDPEHGRLEVRPSGPNDRERRGRDADSSRHRRELPDQRARLPRPDGHRGTKRRRSGLERGSDGSGARGLHDERVGANHDRPDSARRRAGSAWRAHDDPRAPRRDPLDSERERPDARQSRWRGERRRGPGRGLETGPHGRDPPDRGLPRRDGGERGEHDGGSRGATHRGMDGRPRLPADHLEPRGAAPGPGAGRVRQRRDPHGRDSRRRGRRGHLGSLRVRGRGPVPVCDSQQRHHERNRRGGRGNRE